VTGSETHNLIVPAAAHPISTKESERVAQK
jgi:hypothetical protein